MTCQTCGTEHSSKYCPECGTAASQMAACPLCGFAHANKYCPECGTAAPTLPVQAETARAVAPVEPVDYYQYPPQYQSGGETVVYTQPLPQTQPQQQPAPVQPGYPAQTPAPAPTLQATSAQAQSSPTIIINNNNENYNTPVNMGGAYPPAHPGVNFTASPKSKAIALLLCIFLGYFGVHYFYVGKVFKGLLYLFTGGLFGIGWIIDIARIALGGFRDSWGYPLVL